jgi:putative hydrolase
LTDANQNPDFDPEDFAKFLSELLSGNGEIDAQELAKIAGLPDDPEALKALISQIQGAIVSGESQTIRGVNWELAEKQALELARVGAQSIDDRLRSTVLDASNIAALWVDQATSLSQVATTPKLLTRELWVLDAQPLFQALAGPIAERVAESLSENLEANLPEELDALAAGARGLMRSAGGTIFAMQLGQTLGKLSQEVLTGGDIGLPFYSESRPAIVAQNLEAFISDHSLVADEARIYILARELSHARLFKQSRWLRDSVLAQITNYAQGIQIDGDKLRDLASEISPENAEALKSAMESGAFLAERSEEQIGSLKVIENLLALIEGWVTVVTENATKLLPTAPQLGEVLRRRAGSSPARATFATLIGLELQPKRVREAAEFWRVVTERLGVDRRDALWEHPDLLPTSEDIDDVEAFLAGIGRDGDDLDKDLRDLLG